ncbi:MAG: hypothetical protein BWY07_00465 [Candidatus Hydrogenedentes bacterium ADurb.Bin170]|nr:MAG: hypothetical protein BWY07_00465 [Candidatus Hydrogenedentes bacterium ADurb.Bin170]
MMEADPFEAFHMHTGVQRWRFTNREEMARRRVRRVTPLRAQKVQKGGSVAKKTPHMPVGM